MYTHASTCEACDCSAPRVLSNGYFCTWLQNLVFGNKKCWIFPGLFEMVLVKPLEPRNLTNATCLANTLYKDFTDRKFLPIWPKSEIFRRVFWRLPNAFSRQKRIFRKTKKSWLKALWELTTWVWFRIPQSIPNVRARWVAKTAARFYHLKFETNPPWLLWYFKAFLA